MKTLLGVLGILVGIALGLYVGVWVFFVGGIVGLVTSAIALFSGQVLTGLIGWSIVKILFAGIAGYFTGVAVILPSMTLLKRGK